MDWKKQLEDFIDNTTVIMGIGSELKSDDRVGIYIAEGLKEIGGYSVIVAGPTPEHWVGFIAKKGYRKVLIVDSVIFGGESGDIQLFDIDEISERFGLTHTSSLHLFADFISGEGSTESIRILAVEPETLVLGEELSHKVKKSADEIIRFFTDLTDFLPQRHREHREE